MAKYKMLSGEIHRDKFEVLLPSHIRSHLEAKCRAEWRDLHQLGEDISASPYIPVDTLKRSIEGRIHWEIVEAQFPLDTYFYKPWHVYLDAKALDALMAAVQTQGRGPRGTRQRFRDGYNDITAFRRFRSWWLARELADRYGLPFEEKCPVEAILPVEPTFESIINNFEEWTGYKVAPEMLSIVQETYNRYIQRQNKQQLAA